jgi:hypothetical protein
MEVSGPVIRVDGGVVLGVCDIVRAGDVGDVGAAVTVGPAVVAVGADVFLIKRASNPVIRVDGGVVLGVGDIVRAGDTVGAVAQVYKVGLLHLVLEPVPEQGRVVGREAGREGMGVGLRAGIGAIVLARAGAVATDKS